jgi:hypothetical protein
LAPWTAGPGSAKSIFVPSISGTESASERCAAKRPPNLLKFHAKAAVIQDGFKSRNGRFRCRPSTFDSGPIRPPFGAARGLPAGLGGPGCKQEAKAEYCHQIERTIDQIVERIASGPAIDNLAAFRS